MKNIYKIIFIVFLSLFLISCDSGKKAFEKDYVMFEGKEHVFKKVSFQKAYASLTSKKGYQIIVFAFDPDYYECPYCMMVLPIINEVALEEGIKEIYYLDIYMMRKNRDENYLKLINYLSSQVELEKRNGLDEIIVPDLYIVKDGKVLAHHIATFKDNDGKYILNLTSEQLIELKTIYRNMFSLKKS